MITWFTHAQLGAIWMINQDLMQKYPEWNTQTSAMLYMLRKESMQIMRKCNLGTLVLGNLSLVVSVSTKRVKDNLETNGPWHEAWYELPCKYLDIYKQKMCKSIAANIEKELISNHLQVQNFYHTDCVQCLIDLKHITVKSFINAAWNRLLW